MKSCTKTFLTLNARNEKPQRKPWQPFLQQKAVWFPQDGIFECQKDIQLSGKKKKKILQLLTRKAKVPFLKSWPHNFVSGQSLYCCATLLHRQVPQVWIEKCSGLSLIFFEIKILNMNEVSKTQKLLEITSKEWKCNAKKNPPKTWSLKSFHDQVGCQPFTKFYCHL